MCMHICELLNISCLPLLNRNDILNSNLQRFQNPSLVDAFILCPMTVEVEIKLKLSCIEENKTSWMETLMHINR